MTSNTIRNYRSLMRQLWLRIQADPANTTLEMWGKLRYYGQVTGVRAADVRGPAEYVPTGTHQAQAWKRLVAPQERKA
jgi:hypothetical protein